MIKSYTILLLASMAAAAPLAAQTVNVGMPHTGAPQANCYPFGCPTAHNTFEQLYSSQLFTGPFAISAVSFFNSAGTGVFGADTYNFYFSTTSATPATLAVSPLAASETYFGSLTVGATLPASVFTLTGNTFAYDPAAGNLLLRVTFGPSGFTFAPKAYFDVASSPYIATVSDYSAFLGSNNSVGSGLVTRFDGVSGITAVTPEPATMTLMAMGLVGMAGPMLRRRKRTS